MKCAGTEDDCSVCKLAVVCEIPGIVKKLKASIKQLTKAMDCELRDPYGPIWDHLHKENEHLKELLHEAKYNQANHS